MHRSVPRASFAFVLGGAAILALSSCSVLGGAATSTTATPSTTTTVSDPSAPSPTAPASASDAPSATPSTAPSSAPSASASASAPATRTTVTPFITTAAWDDGAHQLVASAIVPKVVEQGGICTLTATRDGVTRTASAGAGPGAQSTGCGSLAVPGSKLTAGRWTVTVSYESSRYRGTSASRTVTVA